MARPQIVDARPPAFTTWVNPTEVPQMFVIDNQRYVCAPHKEIQVPSQFDFMIQTCSCDNPNCKNEPRNPHISNGKGSRDPWCKHPSEHNVIVLGGIAPMLVRKGMDVNDLGGRDKIDPDQIEARRLEAEQQAAAMVAEAAETTMLIAERRKQSMAAKVKKPATSEG